MEAPPHRLRENLLEIADRWCSPAPSWYFGGRISFWPVTVPHMKRCRPPGTRGQQSPQQGQDTCGAGEPPSIFYSMIDRVGAAEYGNTQGAMLERSRQSLWEDKEKVAGSKLPQSSAFRQLENVDNLCTRAHTHTHTYTTWTQGSLSVWASSCEPFRAKFQVICSSM